MAMLPSLLTPSGCLTVPEMYQPHFALDQHTGMCLPASCLSSSFYPPSLIRVGWYPIGDHPIKYSSPPLIFLIILFLSPPKNLCF